MADHDLERKLEECRLELNRTRRQLLRKEAELAASREHLGLAALLLDTMPVLVCLKDSNFSILYANAYCRSILGEPGDTACYRYLGRASAPCDHCPLRNEKTDTVTRIWELPAEPGRARSFQVIDVFLNDDDGRPMLLSIGVEISERAAAERNLRRDKAELERCLEDRNDELRRKNIALTEVLGQLEVEKQNLAEKVELNVQKILLPVIDKLIEKSSTLDRRYLMLIKQNLQNLTSATGKKLAHPTHNLTPKEIELCTLIKGGFTIKEIATMHNLSERTVETHRLNIRRKLGLTSARVNLTAYLSSL